MREEFQKFSFEVASLKMCFLRGQFLVCLFSWETVLKMSVLRELFWKCIFWESSFNRCLCCLLPYGCFLLDCFLDGCWLKSKLFTIHNSKSYLTCLNKGSSKHYVCGLLCDSNKQFDKDWALSHNVNPCCNWGWCAGSQRCLDKYQL